MKNRCLLYTTLALLAAPSVTLHAEEQEWLVGAAIVGFSEPWEGVDNDITLTPMLSGTYGNWQFFEQGLVSYRFLVDDNFAASVGVSYRNDAYDADGLRKSSKSDAKVFEGYKAPDGDVTVVANLEWHMFSMTFEQDVSGHSKGLTVDASAEVPIFTLGERLSVSALANVHWMSDNYANYVYGIQGSQVDVSKGRTAYSPDASFSYSVGLNAYYAFDQNWILMSGLDYTWLDDNVKRSPLVGKDYTASVYMGVMYQF